MFPCLLISLLHQDAQCLAMYTGLVRVAVICIVSTDYYLASTLLLNFFCAEISHYIIQYRYQCYCRAVGVGAAGAAEAAPLFQPAYLGIILLLDGCYSATTTIFSQKLN